MILKSLLPLFFAPVLAFSQASMPIESLAPPTKNALPQSLGMPCSPNASKRTVALFQNLKQVAQNHIMLGQQDALAYGIGWKREAGRSDIKSVCGSHPAVFGWDLGRLIGPNHPFNIDSIHFEDQLAWIKEGYAMGGVNTISWHVDNFVSKKSSWDTTASVAAILPGGAEHAAFIEQLDRIAIYLDRLETGRLFKKKIPVIFRPWHEHTGGWFWWGATHCTAEEYKQLFRFTVDYLRNTKGLRHVLFAYSPDVFKDEKHYMERYPGDEWVDLMGFDFYYRENNYDSTAVFLPKKLGVLTSLAAEHGKIAAITETGYEAIPDPKWWTGKLLSELQNAPLSYVLVWRNANTKHHYAPYPGHVSERDFLDFVRTEKVLMQNELPKLYKKPKF